MDKTTKIALYSIGGLVLATGLFFGIRSIAKSNNDKEGSGLSASEKRELEALRKKDADGIALTPEQQAILDKEDNKYTPGDGETTTLGGISFPLNNGANNKAVAQIQLAINEKHGNNQDDHIYGYCCTGNDQELMIDGNLGGKTAKAIKKYYDLCCKCEGSWYTLGINRTCNCLDCKITEGSYKSIISGADVSDEALQKAGFSSFSGYSEFNGSSNFNVPGFGKKYDSPLGNFYKSKFAFTDDYPKQSEMEHSYGMGKGFGFAGGTDNLSFNGKTGTESEIQTVQEFFDDVP